MNDPHIAVVIADLTMRAEVAEAEQRALKVHLTYSESRRCKHSSDIERQIEHQTGPLKAQIAGLLSQVRELGLDRKLVLDALWEMVRRALCPDLLNQSTRSPAMFQAAIADAEKVLKRYGRL